MLGAGAVSWPGRCGCWAAGGCWELLQSLSRAVALTVHPGSGVQRSLTGERGSFSGPQVWVSVSSRRLPGWVVSGEQAGPSNLQSELVLGPLVSRHPVTSSPACHLPRGAQGHAACSGSLPAPRPGATPRGDRAGCLGAGCPRGSPGWEPVASLGVNRGRIWPAAQILLWEADVVSHLSRFLASALPVSPRVWPWLPVLEDPVCCGMERGDGPRETGTATRGGWQEARQPFRSVIPTPAGPRGKKII